LDVDVAVVALRLVYATFWPVRAMILADKPFESLIPSLAGERTPKVNAIAAGAAAGNGGALGAAAGTGTGTVGALRGSAGAL
jgi:hypothetical protein